ncbi:MAG: hypothetical protein ACRD99_06265 [Nitrososphaera sp.]
MFVVKRLGRNGMWNAVSLIDENGSFRGEAKFETREQAEDYMQVYLGRMKERLRASSNPAPQVKVFDESTPEPPAVEIKEPAEKRKKLVKNRKRRKKHENRMTVPVFL